MKDDHPATKRHRRCKVAHGGRWVQRHCRCGAPWPCALESLPIIHAPFTMPGGTRITVEL